ncbi:hypothetical protein [Arcticibacter tournemirensis]|uniref:Serine protease n=1 Tax=Arcticibacter tournemirensis TaxID=699437 RepID=A0A4Q0MEB5_9SPHI|nr:hypothetical protein [Arcticibacter tournemirensis]RXF71176.1 hypothetical protein EKH83_05630 [Arcticibacter tournemirensis]
MSDWWSALSLFDKIIWLITIPVTVIFIIEMIFTFAGMDSNSDLNADFDGDLDSSSGDGAPFQLFTFRNFINFFLGFGWSVIALKSTITNQLLLVATAAAIGLVLVAIVMYLFFWLTGMAQDGSMDLRNAVRKTAEVYLTIPPRKTGIGKVHIRLQGNVRELDAVTLGESVKSGEFVTVTDIVDGRLLLVEKMN